MVEEKKHILITGANGFIGQQLVEAAMEKGFYVYGMVRKKSIAIPPKSGEVVYADINDEAGLLQTFKKFQAQGIKLDYIIHAAALTKAVSKKDIFQTNYYGTENLLKVLEQLDYYPGKIVFISSLAACGPAKSGQVVGLEFKNPVTIYGQSKLKAEELIKRSGIPYLIIRPTAVYGPGEKDLFSVFQLISKNINPVLGRHPQELTFIYVKDLVDLILNAADSDRENETYFASDGQVYTKFALAQAIALSLQKKPTQVTLPLPLVKLVAFIAQYSAAIVGKTSAINLEKYNELIAGSWNCEVEKTMQDFQFSPRYTLQKGVDSTTQWYKEHQWIK